MDLLSQLLGEIPLTISWVCMTGHAHAHELGTQRRMSVVSNSLQNLSLSIKGEPCPRPLTTPPLTGSTKGSDGHSQGSELSSLAPTALTALLLNNTPPCTPGHFTTCVSFFNSLNKTPSLVQAVATNNMLARGRNAKVFSEQHNGPSGASEMAQ